MKRGTTEFVRVGAIDFDPRVNRDLRSSRVDHIAAKFDRQGLGIITVSQREDGRFVAIDGQHRVGAMKLLGLDNEKVEARVYRDLTIAEEARLFLVLNDTRIPRPVDRYLKGVVSGDERYVAIDQVVRAAGFAVSLSGQDGSIRATVALEKVFDTYGEKALGKVLWVASSAWGRTQEAVESSILQGIANVIGRYSDQLDIESLISKLSKFPGGASGLLGKARGLRDSLGGALPGNVAAIIVQSYNRSRRSGSLPEWWTK